jgi:hypothetical protein
MDKITREDLNLERRVAVSEAVPLDRPTVQALCETITQLFKDRNKPTRVLYTKGEGLLVEKTLPESQVPKDGEYVTPYQMVRQHADVEILESMEPALMLCRATMALADKGHVPTALVSRDREAVDKWFTGGKIDVILRLPFFEDLDCPDGYVVLAGSQTGGMLGQIEYAVMCKME